MTIRARRKLQETRKLEDMSNAELAEIIYFGNLMRDPHTTIFKATEDDQARAYAIMQERCALNGHTKHAAPRS